MLPYFKTVEEVRKFLGYIDNRVRNILLLETAEAIEALEEIENIDGIDEIHVGLNDLSLSMKKKFMFEVLADGTVDGIAKKLKEKNIAFGFGGVASVGTGMLPAEMIIGEHYRLGSQGVILSRSFCNSDKIQNLEEINKIFEEGVRKVRKVECEWEKHKEQYEENHQEVKKIVEEIVKKIK